MTSIASDFPPLLFRLQLHDGNSIVPVVTAISAKDLNLLRTHNVEILSDDTNGSHIIYTKQYTPEEQLKQNVSNFHNGYSILTFFQTFPTFQIEAATLQEFEAFLDDATVQLLRLRSVVDGKNTDDYYYKIDGKSVSKAYYLQYENKPGDMEGGGKQTNNPDVYGRIANNHGRGAPSTSKLNTLDIADLSIETYPIHISNSDTFEMTIYDDPLGTTTSTSNACFSSGHVWEGSELLSEYLVSNVQVRQLLASVGGAAVLELGSGLGLAGITASILSNSDAPIVLTDTKDALPLLELNVQTNVNKMRVEDRKIPQVRVAELKWGDTENMDLTLGCSAAFRLILGSELMYEKASAILLATTLNALIQKSIQMYGIEPTILFTHGDRKDKTDAYFKDTFLQQNLVMTMIERKISKTATKNDPDRKYTTLYEIRSSNKMEKETDETDANERRAALARRQRRRRPQQTKDNLASCFSEAEYNSLNEAYANARSLASSTASSTKQESHDDDDLDDLLSMPFTLLNNNTPTWGKNAIYLFRGHTPSIIPGGLGFHCHPHIGIYGQDFTPAFPLVAISLPPTERRLSSSSLCLPPEVLSFVKSKKDVQYYFLIHSYPGKRPCQKFTCNRNDEINLMLHPFIFQDDAIDTEYASIRNVQVGAFATEGVHSTHLDLEDCGVPFEKLEQRTVAIHDMCFSPCNLHIRVDYSESEKKGFAYFCTVAAEEDETKQTGTVHTLFQEAEEVVVGMAEVAAGKVEAAKVESKVESKGMSRCAVTVHCLPLSQTKEDDLWNEIKDSKNIEELIGALSTRGSEDNLILVSKLCGFIQ